MGFLEDLLGAERIEPRTIDPAICACCAGGTSGIGYLCGGCRSALEAHDRHGHPHPLSNGQRALAERGGGGGVEEVTAHGFDNPDGTITIVGVSPPIVDQLDTLELETPGDSPSP